MRSKRIMTLAAAIAASAALALSGCAGGGGASSGGSTSLTLATGGVFTQNNNPFAPTSSATANGWAWLIYEPLVQTNSAIPTQKPVPWLSTKTAWSSDYRSVSFTARDGVKWSDGKAFSASDIQYTFDLIRKNKALNSSGIPYSGVTRSGDEVTVSFSEPQFVNQTKITGQFIVPEHIWSEVDNPSTYADTKPVGTGPFVFSSSTSSVAKLTKNPGYWKAGDVKVDTVAYQAFQGNDPIVNALAAHKVDWASSFALNQKSGFTAKDKRNIAWNVSTLGMDAFVLNTAKAPFDDPALRRAINLVIDREKAAKLATGDLLSPITSVTGIPQPVGDDFIASAYQGKDLTTDASAAKKILEQAGYTLVGGVLTAPDGKAVTMTMIDPAGWTDYLTELQVIRQNLTDIGIKATIQTPSQDAWNAALASGDFDAAIRYSDSGSTPYDIYATFMDTSKYAPIGQTVDGNWSRFSDKAADEALSTYATATDDASRSAALAKLQDIWVEQVPAIGLISKASTGMFTTVNWKGWPSAKNPYADPSILSKNISQVVTTIRPAP